jgi:uncharacterized protein with von Willebrand factor type A (vWA) domain
MKLYISLAALALSAINAGRVEDAQAEALNFAKNNQILSDDNQAKLQAKAEKELAKYAKLAEKAGKDYGIKFDLEALGQQLLDSYQDDAIAAGQNLVKNINRNVAIAERESKTNKQFKQAQKQLKTQAKTMTFGKALNQLEKGLNGQLSKAGMNANLAKQLKTILRQGKNAAVKEIKNAGFKPNANIANTAQKQFNRNQAAVKQQILSKQQELNRKANQAVNNM